ncbi:MAG TPA: DUF429 domain-containing protein [Baekduia sp.]|uniref:DUF429 domain-containing protein n=1 Tax=Baekduia sp. TaxID=2600305 RepID=UPI002B917559|nr:DUF429 domain-containing protein [Baekduia sp.]HMJ33917.1 DUF429 domain-containing protein [Baekduia sp.]
MTVLGIDLAAGAPKTYACLLEPSDDQLHARIAAGCGDEELRQMAHGCAKVAIDAPFGWPDPFVDALVAHRAANAWPAPDDEPPEIFRASLSFRTTDRVTMHTRRPLSVSTDRLGVTAMRCAHLLHRWSADGETVDRTGRSRFVEVYPAAALVRWGLSPSGYKGSDGATALATLADQVIDGVDGLVLLPEDRELCRTVDDALDSLLAALVGRAATLGLTDGPPPEAAERARTEGWIHLPVRGSLRFLARPKSALAARPAAALAARLRASGVPVDDAGYAPTFDDALLPGFSPPVKDAIRDDLKGKGGSELVETASHPPKFHAAHSSAGLAANAFGPFLTAGESVPFDGRDFRGDVHLEVKCPTGLPGTPPTLDVLVDGTHVLAIESKCTEPFATHEASFSTAYAALLAPAHRSWRDEFDRLIQDPRRYRHLDAAQLIKHYLGLCARFNRTPVTLAYIYWSPTDAGDLAPCAIHAAEVAEFSSRVADPAIRFVAMGHDRLWDAWSAPHHPPWLIAHAAALRDRYAVPAG